MVKKKKHKIILKKASRLTLKKFATAMLLVGLNIGILNIPETLAFYNDAENSNGNIFSAKLLDFQLTNNILNKIIGPEALGEISHASVAMPEDDSLDMQYVLDTLIATTTSNDDFCNGLVVEAKNNGITKYNGLLSGLTSATTTEFGTWEFRFDLPPNISVPHGVKCNASANFSAWRADVVNPEDSGWYDEETLDISFTARMVVLNEIYARPATGAVAPKNREYVELYNNGSTPVDVLGWQISEISGSTEKFYTVVASASTTSQMQPFSGNTIIPAGGFLVLVFNTEGAEHFNNTGDTIKLYDSTTLLDSHSYPSLAIGKAVVRFPDGIGFWVDPEPTPGTTNTVSLEELRLARFDDFMIAQVLELASFKNVSMLENLTSIISDDAPVVATTTEETATTTPEIVVEEVVEEVASSTSETIEPVPAIVEPEPAIIESPIVETPIIEPELAVVEPVPVVIETEPVPIIETP